MGRASARAVVAMPQIIRGSRGRSPHRSRFAEAFAQQADNLADLDNLLGGREDEGRETFPRFLAQQPQPATRGDGLPHWFVVGKSFQDVGEVNVGLQIIFEELPIRDGCSGAGVETVVGLCEREKMFAQNAVPAVAGALPANCLLYTSPSPRDGLLSRMPSSA